MKKLLILLLALCMLGGCSKQEAPIDDETDKTVYIEPVNDVDVFGYLKKDVYDRLYKANGDKEVESYLLEYIGNDLIDYELTDIDGNTFELSDYKDSGLIIEIAGNWCSHCKDQALQYTDELLEAYPDLVFIQYFNEGNADEIKAFYAEIGHPMPENVIIVPEDNEFSSRLLSSYNPKFYPGFLFFKDGKLSWIKTSSLSREEMDLCYDVAFNNVLNKDELTDEKGTSIFDYKRNKDDVRKDLGEERYALIESLDNDGRTIDNTLSFIGKDFGYKDQYENDSSFVAEADFLDYEDGDLAIIYYNKAAEPSITLINDFYKANPDIGVIVLNVTDEDNEEMAELSDPPVISIMNQVPKMLNEVVFDSYPSCLYVKKGTITGAFSNISDLDMFNKSVDIFLRDPIAVLSDQ